MFDDEKYSKFFTALEALSKTDMSVMDAINIARKHNPKAGKVLARHVFTDSMVPKVGNTFAYKDFLSRNQNTGIHLSLDANGFGSINKEHGHPVGDEAIKHLFNTVSDVSRKYGLKAFRVGGDEGRLHAPTPARAEGFVKELKERLANSPNVAGTNHKLSVSVGIGYSPEHAEQALIRAKDQLGPLVDGKRIKTFPLGKEPTVHHSLLHENPPPLWRPQTGTFPALPHEEVKETATPGLKLHNPLKDT
jgi:diguanylate cyclase (GGDEF)-like protein